MVSQSDWTSQETGSELKTHREAEGRLSCELRTLIDVNRWFLLPPS